MILQKILAYYPYIWLLLGAVAFVKALASFFINKELEGFNGFLFSTFKWYSEEDRDMCESSGLRLVMRLLNILAIIIYFLIGVIALLSILPMFLKSTSTT